MVLETIYMQTILACLIGMIYMKTIFMKEKEMACMKIIFGMVMKRIGVAMETVYMQIIFGR